MNASPALPTRPSPVAPLKSPRGGALEGLPVPAKWRAAQIFVLALIGALALYYNYYFVDWATPTKTFLLALRQRDLEIFLSALNKTPFVDQIGFLILAGLTWQATPTAGTIAVSSFKEALRRRWVVGFLLFSMLVIGFSGSLSFVQLGEELRFLQDFGTGFIITMTTLIAIFLGVSLVPPEIERRTILTILSKPVNRLEFLVGKFLGLCLTLLFCVALLGAFFLLTYTAFSLKNGGAAVWQSVPGGAQGLGFQLSQMCKALVLNYGQLCVLAALSMALSLIVTPITAITFCFLAYFGGQMSSYWGHLGGDEHAAEGESKGLGRAMQGVVKIVYYALPRMDHFDVRQKLVTDEPVSFAFVWKAWSSGLLYIAVLLVIGYLVFSDREF
ncbi:ABC-type transport system involved in multi-copper enzyme maturation, permease component [Abditibacterium utsteinense]|uniref:ABC-type transport system involved in multi-copper enzyme maturation, permease component n=1 Tax=Abditibacterium utsteinense TaxID=1960156 RepID=A0A2S8SUY6_9BACT|nr:ABC transporter permease [Abditibacterium utsteinense]PQV64603.1 ABC-type transport system involved in multi-copper enzyme maturation, permease component [Abditibacterium utsteinense]